MGKVTAFLAAASLGVMAGFFFAFSTPTMPGLAAVDASVFIPAMQQINVAVRNGLFMAAFAGPLLFCALSVMFNQQRFLWFAALALYGAAVGITAEVNVPINKVLALWSPMDPPEGWAETRDTWIQANHTRGAATFLAFLIALFGLQKTAGRVQDTP